MMSKRSVVTRSLLLLVFVSDVWLSHVDCAPVSRFRRQSRDGPVDVKLPFSDILNLPGLAFGKGKGAQQLGAPNPSGIKLNLPFSDFGVPDMQSLLTAASGMGGFGGLGGLLGGNANGGFLKNLLQPLLKKKPVALNYGDGPKKGINTGQYLSRSNEGQRAADSQAAWSVINMPFASFNLPLSSVSHGDRQELPVDLQHKIQQLRQREAQNGGPRPPTPASRTEGMSPFRIPEVYSPFQSSGSSGNSKRPPLYPRPGLGNLDFSQVVPKEAMRGNADTMHQMTGPRKGGPDLPLPNQLGLPLSVVDAPLSIVNLPLSRLMLPFSHLNPVVHGVGALLANQADANNGTVSVTDVKQANGTGFRSPIVCDPEDLVCQATASLTPDLPINLNSLSLPYSFLNTPLSFFNLPLSYLNLPYGSTNFPLGHLNLPMGFTNLPFFELLQTFGGPPIPAARSSEDRSARPLRLGSPLDRPKATMTMRLKPSDIRLNADAGGQGTTSNAATTAESVVPVGSPGQQPSSPGSIYFDPAELILNASKIEEFIEALHNASTSTDVKPVQFNQPGKPLAFADSLIRKFALNKGGLTSKNPAAIIGNLLRQAGGSAMPAIPQMFGLLGSENALFVTPFSLANFPTGFIDDPMAFLNLPLSHFNLPLSHMTLPFSGFSLPIEDIKEPEIHQTVETADIELADVTPSLLQVLNPSDPLRSYVNMPLSEMNLPISVFDMPFTVFDLPFAFMNLPLAHLNQPFTHLHLPFEISSLPFAELALPFEGIIGAASGGVPPFGPPVNK